MPRAQHQPGQHGEFIYTPLIQDEAGAWVRCPERRKPTAWKARATYRDWSNRKDEVSRRAPTKAQVTKALEQALRERLGDSGEITAAMPLTTACEQWLADAGRRDSKLSARSLSEYKGAYERTILGLERDYRGEVSGEKDTPIKHLTLGQANDVQRLTRFLRAVADERGTASVKHVRAVLSNVLQQGVESGVLSTNAMRSVRRISSDVPRARGERDTSRAFTRHERDAALAHMAAACEAEPLERTRAKRQATSDLCHLLAATGVRVGEALRLRWEHVDLDTGVVAVSGTKSAAARRNVNLPAWALENLHARAQRTGTEGLVFHAPTGAPEAPWDAQNCSRAITSALADAGYPWARSHSFRKTVATLLDGAVAPIAAIADQLGHSSPTITTTYYLARDAKGSKASLAALL